MGRSSTRLLAALACSGLLLAACSSDKKSSSSTAGPTTTGGGTQTTTGDSGPTTDPPASGWAVDTEDCIDPDAANEEITAKAWSIRDYVSLSPAKMSDMIARVVIDERERILSALKACNWNRVRAAELSGIPRRTFYRRLRKYGIQ